MQLRKYLSLFLLFVYHLGSAQSYSHEWVKGIGSTDDELGLSIAVDSQGNVYTTGFFFNTADFDPGPNTTFLSPVGNSDAFVQKLDQNGNFLWAKQIGGTFTQLGKGITTDTAGNVYITGLFFGETDFDPGIDTFYLATSTFNDPDIFVEKLAPNGDFLWAKQLGGNLNDQVQSIAVDALGNVCTTGFFSGTADFDPSGSNAFISSEGERDIFIQKMDTDGNFLWAKSMGGPYSESSSSLTIDNSGNIYTTGGFVDTIDFDPGIGVSILASEGSNGDAFIQKLSPNGGFQWAHRIGGMYGATGSSIDVDSTGNIYLSGQFSHTVDFDPGAGVYNLTAFDGLDFFVEKLDGNGNFIWAKSIFGVNDHPYGAMRVDDAGNVFSTGFFQGTVDFDPGLGVYNLTSLSSLSSYDIFTLQLDPDGNFVWVKHTKGTSFERASSLCIGPSGSIYSTGFFKNNVDFNTGGGVDNLSSVGDWDVYIHKLSPCTPSGPIPTGTDVITACDSLVWIDGNTYYSDNSTAMFTILGGSEDGCGDSLATLNLTILNSTNSVDIRQECAPFTWIDGNSYISDNNTASFTIYSGAANGCDSIITLDLTILHPAVGLDTQIGCISYTWIDGNTYTTDNNTATFTMIGGAANGCDSTVTLDLTMNYVNTITTTNQSSITSTALGSTYQWLDCYNSYSVLLGETNQSFTPSINGSYAVEVTENGCVDTSNCVIIIPADILENTLGHHFTLAPNPSNGKFTVQFDEIQESLSILLISVSGQVLQNYNYEGESLIEVELNQPNGVYILEIKNDIGKRAVLKIVKK